MSNVARVAGQAANTLVKPLNVEDVFSTYLYTGNGSTQTINNGIDLDGEGGLVWIKDRNYGNNHFLWDTNRGVQKGLITSTALAEQNEPNGLTAFNSNGFSVGSSNGVNPNTYNMASWTFRKAPKFFDVVTWDGNSTAGREIAHNLGATVGCIMVKCTTAASNWLVYHRGVASDAETDALFLNLTNAAADSANYWNDAAPTSTHFTVGTDDKVNQTGRSYVAYLFAHNDGDGEFGPDGDADIIKCGSYTNSGSAWSVDLGFEPQWILRKLSDGIGSWELTDNMRGLLADNGSGTAYARLLKAEVSNAENNAAGINITSTGLEGTGSGDTGTWIYIAIRRGPMAVPESATDVFAISDRKNEIPSFPSGFPVDFLIGPRNLDGDNNEVKTRLISGGYLRTNTTGAENISDQSANFAHNDGFFNFSGANANQYSWMWKRAPSFCDVVAYTGDGVAGRTVSHNLGVAPEMMWVKKRSSATNSDWGVYHSGLNGGVNPEDYYLRLNDSLAETDNATYWNDTAPTSNDFTLGTQTRVNNSGDTYIAYLFASLYGVSKVGSYTGNGTNQNIDCGFSSGARFVLIKGTNVADWYLFDSDRGIVAGGDPVLHLNSTLAEISAYDAVDPYSGGFKVNQVTNLPVNASGQTYIFYAIA